MKRTSTISVLLLAAACSSGTKSTTATGGTLGSTHDTSGINDSGGGGGGAGGGATAKADPNLPNRAAYTNPGGMWLPEQMTLPGHVETFGKLGVQIDAKVLSDPLSAPLAAVVAIPGCTASFVSAEGLLVTNHHCVQNQLQLNSTEKDNLVENGFLAKTKADEKTGGPAMRVMVAQAFTDVTKQMRDGLEKVKDPGKRKLELEKRMKESVAACEKGRPHLRCQVSSFFRGGKYTLIESLEIKDVRLAYVPPRAVGNYGGEIDNWAWPRHTGDFSFLRAYVGKDGKPADYSADNVPFQPKHFLKVSDKGVKPADFVMVTGYPGSTSRTETFSETRFDVESFLPYLIAYYQERYNLLEGFVKGTGETAIKAGVAKQNVQNGLEKYSGVLKGLKSGDLMQRKEELDKKIREWAAQPGKEEHKKAIDKLEKLILAEQKTARLDFDRGQAFGGSKLLGTALSLTRWAEERAKKDPERKLGYQERDVARATAGQKQFVKQYDRTLDRAGFRLALLRAAKLPDKERPWLATLLGAKANQKIDEAFIDKTLETWYGAQQLEDEKLRIELLTKGTTAQVKALKDPFMQAAQRIWPIVKAEEKKKEAAYGEVMLVAPFYADAMREVSNGLLAPDANSTLRITYGTVRSFKPQSKDAADWPFTTAAQILQKDTGKDPFDQPKKALEMIKAKKYGTYADPALGGELPVDFLSDLDITGGNSGSPTLNDKGELVGLAFDGTLEGVASDVVFNGATTRTIHVDARYMLWQMDAIDGADHLLKEMGIQPRL